MHISLFSCALLIAISLISSGCNRGSDCDQCQVVNTTYIQKYGVEVPEEDWVVRGEDGKVVDIQNDGVIVEKSYFKGDLEGDTTYTFPHGQSIEKVDTYHKGTLLRTLEYYYSGAPKKETLFEENNCRKVTYWLESGAPLFIEQYEDELLSQGSYYNWEQEEEASVNDFSGMRVIRDAYGQLTSREKIEEGEVVERTLLYPNGAPKKAVAYKKGKVNGKVRTYLPGGEPESVEAWVNGTLEGITTRFKNGEKFAEIPYVKGYKQGVEKRYGEGEILAEEINWVKDKKHGATRIYLGKDTEVNWYHKGQQVSKANFELLNPPFHHHIHMDNSAEKVMAVADSES